LAPAVRVRGPPSGAPRAPGEEITLNREQKAEVIAELAVRLRGSETILAADFRGLTVTQLADLRGRLRGADTEFTVVKNTLARRAASEGGRDALLPYLEGPTGLAWVGGDAAVAAKALAGFASEHRDRITIKGGLLEGADLPAGDVERLARLPAREVLLAQLAGGVASPLSGLAGRLSGLVGGLARALSALQAQREGDSAAA
jgi:large subunit ribosomal protein L10